MGSVDMEGFENTEAKAVREQAEKVARLLKTYCKTEESIVQLIKAGVIKEDERDLIIHGKSVEEYIARFTEREEINALYEKIKAHLGVDDPAPDMEADYENKAL